MSRVGRSPIPVPKGVQITLQDHHITVKGPKGQLERTWHPRIDVNYDNNTISVTRSTDQKEDRSLHGLTRALIANMVKGVTDGFKKELEVVGVGFRVDAMHKGLLLNIGFSHGVFVKTPDEVKVEVPKPNSIVITGIDAELVGQVAASIRAIRKPEPYKGKGIRYANEKVTIKAGKTAK